MKTVGVLGGMGPLATVNFMEKVIMATPATCDQEHVPMMVLTIPQIPDRSEAILNGGKSPLPDLVNAAQKLERMGADFIVITCNTAHNWYQAIQQQVTIPVLHIVDATIEWMRSCGISRGTIGVLATAGTLSANIYTDRLIQNGYTPIIPNAQDQRAVVKGIEAIKAGRLEEGQAHLAEVAQRLLDSGCATVILACTEIPIALEQTPDLLAKCVDATEALAHTTVATVRGLLNFNQAKHGCPVPAH